jgi:hypothetical protein
MQQIVRVARLRTAMAWGVMGPGPAGRLSRFLVGCHPRRWRERYGEEMLDVLDQHQASARTVVDLWASAVSAHLDPAYRTDRLSLARLRRPALISAAIAAPLALVLAPLGYRVWQDTYWHPAAMSPSKQRRSRRTRASWLPPSGKPSTAWTWCGTSRT